MYHHMRHMTGLEVFLDSGRGACLDCGADSPGLRSQQTDGDDSRLTPRGYAARRFCPPLLEGTPTMVAGFAGEPQNKKVGSMAQGTVKWFNDARVTASSRRRWRGRRCAFPRLQAGAKEPRRQVSSVTKGPKEAQARTFGRLTEPASNGRPGPLGGPAFSGGSRSRRWRRPHSLAS
jgi:hypothetical protein